MLPWKKSELNQANSLWCAITICLICAGKWGAKANQTKQWVESWASPFPIFPHCKKLVVNTVPRNYRVAGLIEHTTRTHTVKEKWIAVYNMHLYLLNLWHSIVYSILEILKYFKNIFKNILWYLAQVISHRNQVRSTIIFDESVPHIGPHFICFLIISVENSDCTCGTLYWQHCGNQLKCCTGSDYGQRQLCVGVAVWIDWYVSTKCS